MVSAKINYIFKTEMCVQVLHAGLEHKVNWTFCIRFDLIFNEQFWVFKLVEILKSWREKKFLAQTVIQKLCCPLHNRF